MSSFWNAEHYQEVYDYLTSTELKEKEGNKEALEVKEIKTSLQDFTNYSHDTPEDLDDLRAEWVVIDQPSSQKSPISPPRAKTPKRPAKSLWTTRANNEQVYSSDEEDDEEEEDQEKNLYPDEELIYRGLNNPYNNMTTREYETMWQLRIAMADSVGEEELDRRRLKCKTTNTIRGSGTSGWGSMLRQLKGSNLKSRSRICN